MTPSLKPIVASFHTTDMVLSLALADLTEQDARRRARNEEGPSISWHVGHMLDCRYSVLRLLGIVKESPYKVKFGSGRATDGSDYPSTADFLRQWKQLEAEMKEAVDAATEESLARTLEKGPHGERTVLDKIAFLAWHEAAHIGSLGSIRKALGYPGLAELVRAQAAA